MKKMILLGLLILFIPVILHGQDKVEAPVWNVGDKWDFGKTTMVVVGADESNYTVRFSSPSGDSTFIYDKSSLNRLYSVQGDRRVEYKGWHKSLLNFPLNSGKSWKDKFAASPLWGRTPADMQKERIYLETFSVLGWEDIEVKAGKFKALKLEYKQEGTQELRGRTREGKAWFWYSPDVKYLVKCEYGKTDYWVGFVSWELTSFELKK